MGQRSQIYIRYNINYINGSETKNPAIHNYKGLIARYYGWNYGERMISRARYIIECIQKEFIKWKWYFGDTEKLEKLKRICDTNFDMKDIVFSSDIIKEVMEELDGDMEYLFNQANNDGQFFVDVTDGGIKYCFMRFYNEGKPMDGEQYMKWNCEREEHPDWHIPRKYMDKETIDYTEENIKQINKMATLMTKEDVEEFINNSYVEETSQFKEFVCDKKNKEISKKIHISGNAQIVQDYILSEYRRYDTEFSSEFLDFVAPDITVLEMIYIYQEIMRWVNGDDVILVEKLRVDQENHIQYASIVEDIETALYGGEEMVIHQYGDDTTMHQAIENAAKMLHSKGYDLIRIMDMEQDDDGDIVSGEKLDLIW